MNDYLLRLKRFIYRDFDPVTKSILLGAGLLYILTQLLSGLQLVDNLNGILWLNPVNVPARPWTFLTYPLVNDLLNLIFAGLWLWFIGGSLERSWGSRRYGWFWLLTVGVTGVALAAVGFIFKAPIPAYGLWLPAVGLTWAWADLNPHQDLLFWGMVPLRAKWLAWLEVGLTFLTYFNITENRLFNLLFGLAAVSGVAVAHFYRGRNPFGGGGRKNYRGTAAYRSRRSRFRVIK